MTFNKLKSRGGKQEITAGEPSRTWEIKKLGEVCDVIGGGTPSKKNLKFYEGDILWATVRDMKSEVISDTEFKITEEAVKKSSTNIIPKGNVIIATRVGLGKVCLIEKDTAINQDLRGIVPKKSKQLDKGFLFQWFKSISHLIVEEGTGATVQGVKLPFIKDLPIPLPPLPEQQRIVSILDEAFAAIAKAKANAEQNLKNAKELFESYLQGVFGGSTGSPTKRDGWEEKKLGEVVEIINGRNQSQVISENGKYPIYGSAANLMGYATDYLCEKGTTIIGRKGNISNPIYIEERFWNVDTAFGLFPKNRYDTKFIHYLCRTIDFKSRNRGTTIPSLVKSDLLGIDVPFISSLKDQQTIVRQLDALRAETQKLEAVYQKKIDDLEELKKSILQKAFAGELMSEPLIKTD